MCLLLLCSVPFYSVSYVSNSVFYFSKKMVYCFQYKQANLRFPRKVQAPSPLKNKE